MDNTMTSGKYSFVSKSLRDRSVILGEGKAAQQGGGGGKCSFTPAKRGGGEKSMSY